MLAKLTLNTTTRLKYVLIAGLSPETAVVSLRPKSYEPTGVQDAYRICHG